MQQPYACAIVPGNPSDRLRVGFDLVKISGVADSLSQFGDDFRHRLFTASELEYADSGSGVCAERLAARFAAKEAVIKALNLANAGVNFRDIEVVKLDSGACELVIHGRVAELIGQLNIVQMAVSLSHDGDYAGAFVTVLCKAPASGE
ncbi:MAG: holo-ACP synthase [Burkholderiales bacterium]|nr:holo-ACP synthase [Burkholderiales bacterium]